MNLACGLDTRCYRMQGYAHWYNLDLPETIAVREALLPESGSISQLAMSAMDDWGAAVEGPSGPALVSNRIVVLQGTGEEEQPECGGAKA